MRSDGAIMVGVDGGAVDRLVLGWAAEEAVARNADLLVCPVRERSEPSPGAGELEPAGSAELLVRDAANTARTSFPALAVATAVGQDRVVSALVRASIDARMLVVGGRGDHGLPGMQIGSVAERVATAARCPVAVIRPSSAPDLGPAGTRPGRPEDRDQSRARWCCHRAARRRLNSRSRGGRRPRSRWLRTARIGSVSQHVLPDAPCTVLIAR
jgi:nucleotide-binding universal stress UspA family protein